MEDARSRAHVATALTIAVLATTLLPAYLRAGLDGWPTVFDDAFITYRYAQNLALGHGITWNAGQPPTEGYTNFLLVVFLAPWIKAGADPLLVTRILSYVCVCLVAWTLVRVVRDRFRAPTWVALLIAAIVPLAAETKFIVLTGLETTAYTWLLLRAFLSGVSFAEHRTATTSIRFSLLLFATMLLRPEAALLYPVVVLAAMLARERVELSTVRAVAVGLGVLSVAGGTYLLWKYVHFGALLPNPYYLKAAGNGLVSDLGLRSIGTFVTTHRVLLASALAGLCLVALGRPEIARRNRLLGVAAAAVAVAFGVFFARTDTLMDIHGRFLFPTIPMLVIVAAPALVSGLEGLRLGAPGPFAPLAAAAGFVVAFGMSDSLRAYNNVAWIAAADGNETRATGLMAAERRVAVRLAEFPEVARLRIAFGDSGVIPYYTRAQWLDVVGLNDSYIAQTRSRRLLLDYFFGWAPDLIIHPGSKEGWLRTGHGPLGDYRSWARDPRWDAYAYAGTTLTGGRYDLQYFVRTSSPFRARLEEFLVAKVADGRYRPFPLPIGGYSPSGDAGASWIPRSGQ